MGTEVTRSPAHRPGLHPAAVFIAILALMALALVLLPGALGGGIVGDQPPASGDWHVTRDTVATDVTIDLNGSLWLDAKLTLMGSELRIASPSAGEDGINASATGNLVANDSVIYSSSGEPYHFHVHGAMDLLRVTVRDVDQGVRVLTAATVSIEDVSIVDFVEMALYLEGASGTTVKDLRVQADGLSAYQFTKVTTDSSDTVASWSHFHNGIVTIIDGGPTLDGVDISVNGTLTYEVEWTKTHTSGSLEMEVEWPAILVDTISTISIADVTYRDSMLEMDVVVGGQNQGGGSGSVDVNFGLDGIVFADYRDATLAGFNMTRVQHNVTEVSFVGSGMGTFTYSWLDWGHRVVHAFVAETFSTVGPHRFYLDVSDIGVLQEAVFLHRFVPGYSGSASPTFEDNLVLDNVSVRSGHEPVKIYVRPGTSMQNTIDLNVRISNSTFRSQRSTAITLNYPGAYSSLINDVTIIENCYFLYCGADENGLVRVPIGGTNSLLTIRNNKFLRNGGTLLDINGILGSNRDKLVIDGNLFDNNRCWDDQYLILINNRKEVTIVNNTFNSTDASNGVYIYDLGAVKKVKQPCDFLIANNLFTDNWAVPSGGPPRGFFDIIWGGKLVVRDNNITRTGSRFLNLTESTEHSRGCTLEFVENHVHRNDNVVLYFYNSSRDHMKLDVLVQNNTVWDNKGPLVDFRYDDGNLQRDYDATFRFLDNEVVRSADTVFRNYGNITVMGNTFIDCAGWVLILDYLNKEQPYVINNSFAGCGDAILVRAKDNTIVPVLLWMDGNQIDSSGTGLYFSFIEVTVRTTVVSTNAVHAVIADRSYVDAYDCQFEGDTCEIVTMGYIRMWYWIEARVEWASKSGVASGNPVAGANVTFLDDEGNWSATAYTDVDGHLEPFAVKSWHIENANVLLENNPYTVAVSLSSFTTSIVMNVTESHKGDDALLLLLTDPDDPMVSIDSPEKGSAHNTEYLEVRGFATDKASGVWKLELSVQGGPPLLLEPDWEGAYCVTIPDVPEGTLVIMVRATDAGLNSVSTSITVVVDRTPPTLVVTYPSGDLHTNLTQVTIKGEIEPEAELLVNMMEYTFPSGTFEVTLNLNEGANYFSLTATDLAGNTASAVIFVTRDTLDPELELFSPRNNVAINVSEVRVQGRAVDFDTLTLTIHRTSTDIIDRPIYPDAEDQFTLWAELEEGVNVIVVTARDRAGNTVIVKRTVTMDTTPPTLELLSPEDGTLTNQHQITVRFTVSDDADQVYVNGKRVLGTGDQESTVMLGESENPINIWAVDTQYNEVRLSLVVYVDTVAPTLVITSPNVTTYKTNDPLVVVRGMVSDSDLDGITVTVAGLPASIASDGRFYQEVGLTEDGVHTVEVVARDLAGNIAKRSFSVDLLTRPPLVYLSFDPPDAVVDPKTVLKVVGAASELPLVVTIYHDAGGDRTQFTFTMINSTFTHQLELVKGRNTITVRSEDSYGNWNMTDPHVVEVKERTVDQEPKGNNMYLVIAIVVAAALIGVSYVLLRRARGL